MTLFSVRAELVEAPSCLEAKKKEPPFDKLRANGEGVSRLRDEVTQ
jgi:hypothetical protein